MEAFESIRLKVNDNCNFRCNFCHREWNTNISEVVFDDKLQQILCSLRNSIWLKEIHITWWEPTLNTEITRLIENFANLWFLVKMTSNWTSSKEIT